MMHRFLVLRPEPGASRTAALLASAGWEPVLYPLFAVEPVAWEPPGADAFDALLLTSANAVRPGGARLGAMRALPAYCVGDTTARAAREAGFVDVRVGGGDAASTIPMLLADERTRILHPCGADVRPFDAHGLHITRLTVYRAVERGDEAGLEALVRSRAPAAAMVHSPRAGQRLDALLPVEVRASVAIVAISDAAAAATGGGWRRVMVAASRTDSAMVACLRRVASPAD